MSLLSLLEQKQIRSTAQLAEEMKTTSEMIEAQLERYAQLGYVKKTIMGGATCGDHCKTCKGCFGTTREKIPKKKLKNGKVRFSLKLKGCIVKTINVK